MFKALKFLFILAFLFNVIAWSNFSERITKLNPTPKTISLVNTKICNLSPKVNRQQASRQSRKPKKPNTAYNFIPYETCDNKNNYLNNSLSKSKFLTLKMNDSKLSPLCTFAGLNHKLSGAYQKSCNSKPKYTRHKPCLTRNYHRFVHNQITMAAECFHMDPKTLFSLYSTESFLQVNVKPSRRESAEGISQLMPQYAVKHINQGIFNNNLKKDNIYQRNLRYYQSKAPNLQCLGYLKTLEKTVLKKEKKNKCNKTSVDNRVSQDIYYSIAYGLISIKSNIKNLIKNNSLFNDDYSQFFLQQKDTSKVIKCPNKSIQCLSKSKLQVEKYITGGRKALAKAIKLLSKSIHPIGKNNIEDIIVNNFPQFSLHATADQFKNSKLTSFLDNSFVKNYCNIDTIPQLNWYKTNRPKERKSSAKQLVSDVSKLLAEVRNCKQKLQLAYMDIFHSMSNNNQLILNEAGFYQHNGGTKMNRIFRRYIKNLGPHKASNLSYKKFTGKKLGSFRSYILKTDGPSQASNFLYNTPDFDRKGRRIAGSLASTNHNMKIIKKTIIRLKKKTQRLVSTNNIQIKSLDLVSSNEGFRNLCSHY